MNADPVMFEELVAEEPRTTPVREHVRTVKPRARKTDRPTSHAAAASVTPGALEKLILGVFANGDQLTADQICARLPDRHEASVKSALSRVVDCGGLVACGEGTSNRGRRMTKWTKEN